MGIITDGAAAAPRSQHDRCKARDKYGIRWGTHLHLLLRCVVHVGEPLADHLPRELLAIREVIARVGYLSQG